MKGRPDREVYGWAQADGSVIVTYDDDFADQRSYPLGSHHGIVRLRVWPTTIEETRAALERLLDEVDEATLREALVVVGRRRIRVRRPDQPSSGRA